MQETCHTKEVFIYLPASGSSARMPALLRVLPVIKEAHILPISVFGRLLALPEEINQFD